MPRDPPVVYLYPLSNYQQGNKGPLLEKDSSVKERMLRMADLYKKFGMRRVVEGLLIAHEHSHPHVLLLQIGNTYFKLPGGRLRVGEHETDGLRRKLTNKLGTPNSESTVNWQIGELVSTWWRPNFETVMYPYIPPQVASPKECRKIFLTQLPPTGILGVPKNLKLLAVPLFELYDNAHRYGPVIASLPQLLARVKFVFCDHNAQPLINEHINAYQITNIQIYKKIISMKKEENNNNNDDDDDDDHDDDIDDDDDDDDHDDDDNDIHLNDKMDQKLLNINNNGDNINNINNMNVDDNKHNENMMGMNSNNNNNNNNNMKNINNMNVVNAANNNKINGVNNSGGNTTNLGINPLLNYRAGLMGNIYAQNLFQRQLQFQQLMAAQAHNISHNISHNILRIPPPSLRAPNARLILTPTMQPSSQSNQITTNPLMFQQLMAQQQQQQMLPHQMQPPPTNTNTNSNTATTATTTNTATTPSQSQSQQTSS